MFSTFPLTNIKIIHLYPYVFPFSLTFNSPTAGRTAVAINSVQTNIPTIFLFISYFPPLLISSIPPIQKTEISIYCIIYNNISFSVGYK